MIHAVAQVGAAVLLRIHAATVRAVEVTRHIEASCVQSLLVNVKTLPLGADGSAEQFSVIRRGHRSHANDVGVGRPGNLASLDLALGALDGSVEVERRVRHGRLQAAVTAAALARVSDIG